MRDLIDGYFSLRRQSNGLAKHGWRFEGQPWHQDGDAAVRKSEDDWELRVYLFEGDIGATVKSPDGTFTTYS